MNNVMSSGVIAGGGCKRNVDNNGCILRTAKKSVELIGQCALNRLKPRSGKAAQVEKALIVIHFSSAEMYCRGRVAE